MLLLLAGGGGSVGGRLHPGKATNSKSTSDRMQRSLADLSAAGQGNEAPAGCSRPHWPHLQTQRSASTA